MKLNDLQAQIKNGKLLPFYVFTGEEIELQNIYIRQMPNVVRVDSIKEIYRKATSKLLVSKNYTVYVCRDDDEFIKNEKAWTNIAKKLNNATIILLLTNPNKKTKFYKAHEETCMVEFKHMTTGQLLPVVSKLIQGSSGILKYFIEQCNNDYKTILNYIDIFNRLGHSELSKRVIDEFIPSQEEVNVFALADAVMRLDSKEVYRMLDILLEDKNNAMGIIYAIANQLHKCVLVEGYRESTQISKDTGINGWICNNILRDNRIKPGKLLASLRIVQKYDKGIKTGVYEASHACYSMCTEILSL